MDLHTEATESWTFVQYSGLNRTLSVVAGQLEVVMFGLAPTELMSGIVENTLSSSELVGIGGGGGGGGGRSRGEGRLGEGEVESVGGTK